MVVGVWCVSVEMINDVSAGFYFNKLRLHLIGSA